MKFVLSLFLGLSLWGCSTTGSIIPQSPKVSLKDVKLGKVTLTEVQLNATLDVMNPNAYALNLLGIDYQVDALGLTLGKGSLTDPLNLQPGVTQSVKLPLTLTTNSAVKFGQAYLSPTHKELPVTLHATVKLDSPVGPLNLNFQDVKDLKEKDKK